MSVCVCVCVCARARARVIVALFTQHAKRVRCTVLSSATCLDPLYFSTLSHNGTIVGKHLLNLKCVFWFSLQLLSETLFILIIIQPDIIINVPIAVAARSKATVCPSQKPLPHHTQYSKGTHIHSPGGIRTRNPSQRAVADPRFRPRDHRDQTVYVFRKIRKFEYKAWKGTKYGFVNFHEP
jgi:hypothetical protein